MADVGTKTGKQTQVGRDVYETSEGETVSEKSTTFGESAAFIHGVAMQSPSASASTLCFMVILTNGFKRASPVKTDKFSTIGPYKNVIS